MHDHLSERLPRAPMITDAYLLRINIGVKNWCDHPTERWPARIVQWQEHFCLMLRNRRCLISSSRCKALQVEGERIFLRRHPLRLDQANITVARQHAHNLLMVGL